MVISFRTVEIDSQSLPYSRLDWRTAQTKAEVHKRVDTPPELIDPVRVFMREFELNIGVFDIAVDLNGKHIFFECNPAGQYMLMERFTGAPISRDIADLIVDRAHARESKVKMAPAKMASALE